MRKSLLYSLAAAALLLLHPGCQRELHFDLTPTEPVVAETVTASVTGRVTDEKKLPVAGARVNTQHGSTVTDIDGAFHLKKVQLDKDAGFVKIEKPGYFTGSRTFSVSPGGTNYVEIELIPKKDRGTYAAGVGGTFPVPSGGTITFPANAVVNAATGAAYSGTVTVTAFHLNPEAANFNAIMPGALEGINTTGETVALKSFGMMAVELEGAGGEKLQLVPGKPATIFFPIPATLMAKAPQTIPLWYFDETAGRWKEEGTATKQGSQYVGTVGHFSFWNCDAPFKVVDFEAVIKDQNGAPLPFSKVRIMETGDSAALNGSGYTDSAGRISGMIPANISLKMLVYNLCGEMVHVEGVGPLTGKANLGTISVNNTLNTRTYSFSGTVVTCSGAPVADGFVNVLLNGKNYRTRVTNGTFATTLTICGGASQATLSGYDFGANTYTDTVQASTAAGTQVQLKACVANTVNEFMDFTFRGTRYYFLAPADSLTSFFNQGITYISALSYTSGTNVVKEVNFKFSGPAGTGTRPVYSWSLNLDKRYFSSDTLNATITEYGNPGGYIAGSISGNLRVDSLNTPVPVNATFRIKRVR